ncbi:MAG: hypothetical protein ACTSWK_01915 [Promethearchaeota archaeon]
MKINLNEMAVNISKEEGGNREVDITQIKQVMRIFLIELGKFSNEDIIEVIDNHRE